MVYPVAKLVDIQPSPQSFHTTRLTISEKGLFTLHITGCAGSRKPAQKGVGRGMLEIDCTTIVDVGDTMYPDGHDIRGINFELCSEPNPLKVVRPKNERATIKYQDRLRKLAEETTKYFPDIYAPRLKHPDEAVRKTEQEKRRLMILVSGNHEAGAEGLFPEKDPIVMLAKLQSMSDGVQVHNMTSDAAKILLRDGREVPQLSMPHIYQMYEVVREGHLNKVESFLIAIDSTTLCVKEGWAQRDWIQRVVLKALEEYPDANIILSIHHSPHLTTGRRAFSKREGKYLEKKQEVGNQHTRALKQLCSLGFPIKRSIIASAHEHDASTIVPPRYPKQEINDSTPLMVLTSGNGGAISNREGYLTAPPGTQFTQTGKRYHGFASVQISQDCIHLRQFVTQANAEYGTIPACVFQQSFNYQDLLARRTSDQQAPTYFPKSMLENNSGGQNLLDWYASVVMIIRSGELHLLRYFIIQKGDYYQDVLDEKAKMPGMLPLQVLRDFVEDSFSANDERGKLEELSEGLLSLIQYYLYGHGTVFLRQLCLIYNIVRCALQMNVPLSQLTEQGFDAYFKQSGDDIVATQIRAMSRSYSPTSTAPPGGAASASSSPPRSLTSSVNSDEVLIEMPGEALEADLSDSDEDEDEFDESTEARVDAAITPRKREDHTTSAAEILKGEAGKEALEMKLVSKGAFLQAIAKMIDQYYGREYYSKKPIAYLQHSDYFDEDPARLFFMYQLLSQAQDRNFLNIFRAAFDACSLWMKKLLLDYLASESTLIFETKFAELPAYQRLIGESSTDRAELEIQRAYLQHWLLGKTEKKSAFEGLFQETSLRKMTPAYKAIPGSIDADGLIFLWFQELQFLYTNAFHNLLVIFMTSLNNAVSSSEGQEAFAEAFSAEHEVASYFYTTQQHQFFPKAIHRVEDSEERRAFLRTMEKIIAFMPKDASLFSGLVGALRANSKPFQALEALMPKPKSVRGSQRTGDMQLSLLRASS